jgi:hypothetical protein
MKKWLCLLLPLSGVFLLNVAAPASVEKNGCIVHYGNDLRKLSRDYYRVQERKKGMVTYKTVAPYEVRNKGRNLVDYNLNFRGISLADCSKIRGDFYRLSEFSKQVDNGCSLVIENQNSTLSNYLRMNSIVAKFNSGDGLSLFKSEQCHQVMADLKRAGISFNAVGADNVISFYDFATFVPEKLAPAAKVLGGSSY